jgi:2-polyprenyl-3-methyl-5-hydroxy-6-metoxy-1,4-benzoquinol methylase
MGVPEVILETPAGVSRVMVKAEYPSGTGLSALFIRWRPYICPHYESIGSVPFGSLFLDVGCGVVLMSTLLVHSGRVRSVVGIDNSAGAIETARSSLKMTPHTLFGRPW